MITHRLLAANFSLSALMSLPLAISAIADDGTRGTSGCPSGVDSTKWVCLTRDEAQNLKLEKLDQQDQIISLREQVARLRLTAPVGIRRFVQPFATVGAEYLPNDPAWHPYGIAGARVGRVSVWGGFFGEEPTAGVGWNW